MSKQCLKKLKISEYNLDPSHAADVLFEDFSRTCIILIGLYMTHRLLSFRKSVGSATIMNKNWHWQNFFLQEIRTPEAGGQLVHWYDVPYSAGQGCLLFPCTLLFFSLNPSVISCLILGWQALEYFIWKPSLFIII